MKSAYGAWETAEMFLRKLSPRHVGDTTSLTRASRFTCETANIIVGAQAGVEIQR